MGVTDGQVFDKTLLLDHGSPEFRFNLLLMSEGYQEMELPTYQADAQELMAGLLNEAPFDAIDVESALNIWRVDVSSSQSGADDPADCEGGTGAVVATYFDAKFCTDGVPRALTVNNGTAFLVASSYQEPFQYILILVNSDKYGGATILPVSAVSRGTPDWVRAATHEMGHGAFDLADEYSHVSDCDAVEPDHWQFNGVEPARPNITAVVGLNGLKWAALVDPSTLVPTTSNPDFTECDSQPSPVPPGTVGEFDGAGTYHSGLYRPEFDCRMRTYTTNFCAVCRQRIREVLKPFQSFSISPYDTEFSVEPWPATLTWTAGAFESAWEVEISTSADFADEQLLIPTSFSVIENGVRRGVLPEVWLTPGREYHWRVRKAGLSGDTGWTAPATFTTIGKRPFPIGPRTLPAGVTHAETFHPWELEFSWLGFPEADTYEVAVSLVPDFDPDSDPLLFPTVFTALTTATLDIKVEATQYWRVRAYPQASKSDAPGLWCDAVPVETTMPQVALVSPASGAQVYPWPVTLQWNLVKGANHYLVEMAYTRSGVGPDSLQLLKEMGAEPKVMHPGHTLSFNMRPRYLSDHDTRYWAVLVVGPPPLSEPGKVSAERNFVNHGDLTIVELIQAPNVGLFEYVGPESWDPSFGWYATMYWKPVKAATDYVLWLRPVADETGSVWWTEDLAASFTMPAPTPDTDPWEVRVDTVHDDIAPKPGVGIIGYGWGVDAHGPEGILGLGETSGWYSPIEPDPPQLVSPNDGAVDVVLSGPVFAFTSHYTPSGDYRVEVSGGGQAHEGVVAGNPGDVTTFSASDLGFSLVPNTNYTWRVKARTKKLFGDTDIPIDADYAWGPTWSFWTIGSVPEIPVVFSGYLEGSIQVMFCFFHAVEGATSYQFLVDRVTPADVGDPPSQAAIDAMDVLESYPVVVYTDDVTKQQTAEIITAAGGNPASVPDYARIVGIKDTQPLNEYRWRVAACNDVGCSDPSVWALWGENYPWPF